LQETKVAVLDKEKKLLEKHVTKVEKDKCNLETLLEGAKCSLKEAERKFEVDTKRCELKIKVPINFLMSLILGIIFFS